MDDIADNICKSCKCHVSKAELGEINKQILSSSKDIVHDNQLVLCSVCFPWYKISHCAPKTVLGYEIKDPKLFMKHSIDLQNLLREQWASNCGNPQQYLKSKPQCDHEWFEFLHMVTSVKRQSIDINNKLNAESGLTHQDIFLKINNHLNYLEHASIDERLLQQEGWSDYAREIAWPALDKLIIGKNTFVIERHCEHKILIKEVNFQKFEDDDYPLISGQFSRFLFVEISHGRENEIPQGLRHLVGIDRLLSKLFGCLYIPLNSQLQREIYWILQGGAPIVEKYRFLALWSLLDKLHTDTNVNHDVTNLWVENPAWQKSFQLFRSVIKGIGRAVKPTVTGFRILGTSGSIYTVEPNDFLDWKQPWVVKRKGSNGKKKYA